MDGLRGNLRGSERGRRRLVGSGSWDHGSNVQVRSRCMVLSRLKLSSTGHHHQREEWKGITSQLNQE